MMNQEEFKAMAKANRLLSRRTRVARRPGNVLTRGQLGRMECDVVNTTAQTWEKVTAIAAKAVAFRVSFGQSNNDNTTTPTASGMNFAASIAMLPDLSDAAADSAVWTQLTFGGSATFPFPKGAGKFRRAGVWSDWVRKRTILRTDNPAKLPLVGVRHFVAAAPVLTLTGNGIQDFSNWRSHPTNEMKMRVAQGNFALVTNPQGMTAAGAAATSACGILSIEYLIETGTGYTTVVVGDSISEGQGLYKGESWAGKSAFGLNALGNYAHDFLNLAWSGATSGTFANQLADYMAMTDATGKIPTSSPDFLFCPVMSPNDFSGLITNALTDPGIISYGQVYELCRRFGISPTFWTMLCCDTAVHAWGVTDAVRVAVNNTLKALVAKGLPVWDAAALLSGAVDGSGQIQYLPGMSDDHVHPNEPANIILDVGSTRGGGSRSQILQHLY